MSVLSKFSLKWVNLCEVTADVTFSSTYLIVRFIRKKIFRKLSDRNLAGFEAFTKLILSPLITLSLIYVALTAFNAIENSFLSYAVGLSVIMFSFFFQSQILRRAFLIERKMRSDLKAVDIIKRLRNGERPEYAFYIRRFFMDTGVEVNLHPSPWEFFINPVSSSEPLENYLRNSAPNSCPLIKIGGKRYSRDVGLGTIYFRQNEEAQSWRDAFFELALHAKIIITSPLVGESSSLLEEIQWLKKENLLHKTVLIMPPRANVKFLNNSSHNAGISAKVSKVVPVKKVWEESRLTLKENLGIELPEYNSKGGYIYLSDENTGKFIPTYGRDWKSRSMLRDVLKGVLVKSPAFMSACIGIRQLKYLAISAILAALPLLFKETDNIEIRSIFSDYTDRHAYILIIGLFTIFTLRNAFKSFRNQYAYIAAFLFLVEIYASELSPLKFNYHNALGIVMLVAASYLPCVVISYCLYKFQGVKPRRIRTQSRAWRIIFR